MPTYDSKFRTLLLRDFTLIDSLNIALSYEDQWKKPCEQLCLLFYV